MTTVAAVSLSAPSPATAATSCGANCLDFAFTGANQTSTVPKGALNVTAGVNGAGGQYPSGGTGGRATGTFTPTGGTVLNITVGGIGGFGGGDPGNSSGCTGLCGRAGGGMSAVWDGPVNTAATAVLVAGGGGGTASTSTAGGAGGGPSGGAGAGPGGGGGTQAGAGAAGGAGAGAGMQFQGGQGAGGNPGAGIVDIGGGGGGGWFGGGGGANGRAGAAGGGGGGSGHLRADVTGGSNLVGAGSIHDTNGAVRLQWALPVPVVSGPPAGSTQEDNRVPISGTGTPGTSLTVTEGGTTICGPLIVAANGSWSCIPITPLADGSHTVTATATDPAQPAAVYPISAPHTFIVAAVAKVITTKTTANTEPVHPGETVIYTITAKNDGPSAATNVTATDPLAAPMSFVSSASGCTAPAGDGVTVTCGPLASLAPGATTSWTFIAKLASSYLGDGTDLANVATVTSNQRDPGPDNISPPIFPPGPHDPIAALTTVKSTPARPGPLYPGETFEYTLTVTNGGPSDGYDVGQNDPLPSQLAFVSSADGCTGPVGVYGGTVTCGVEPVLPAGAPANVKAWTFTVRINPDYTGDGSDIKNIATATSTNCAPCDPSGPAGPPTPVSPPNADLSSAKAPTDETPRHPGETFEYRVTTTNHGPSTAINVTQTDALPEALAFVSSADGCTGDVGVYGGEVTCGPEAKLSPDAPENVQSWVFLVKIDPAYKGDGTDIANVSTTTSDTDDKDETNNTSPPAGPPGGKVLPPSADLALTKEKAPPGGSVKAGEAFDYKVTVTNLGPSNADNAKAVDPLPSQLAFVSSADGCTGPAGTFGGTVTCGPEPTLAPGTAKSWTFTVRLDPKYKGNGSDIKNKATASSDAEDPNPDNNSNDPSELAATGTNVVQLFEFGIGLVLLGLVLVIDPRRFVPRRITTALAG